MTLGNPAPLVRTADGGNLNVNKRSFLLLSELSLKGAVWSRQEALQQETTRRTLFSERMTTGGRTKVLNFELTVDADLKPVES